MRMEYLTDFLVLAETKSYVEAAERLFISQSSLSKHIKELESDLGGPLFTRSTRKVELTELGMLMLPYARKISALREEFTTAFQDRLKLIRNTVNIGLWRRWDEYPLPSLFAEFQSHNPEIRLNLINYSDEDYLERLQSGDYDLVFAKEAPEHPDHFQRRRYAVERLSLVVSRENPLSKREKVSLEELKHESFILLKKLELDYQVAMEACQRAGFDPIYVINELRGSDAIHLAGKGIGLVLLLQSPEMRKYNEDGNWMNVRCVPLKEDVFAEVSLIGPVGEPSAPTRRFLEFFDGYLATKPI